MTVPPQYSPDGQWWWDGTQWVPASQAPGAPGPVPAPAPGPAVPDPATAPPWASTELTSAPPWAATDPGAASTPAAGGAPPWPAQPQPWSGQQWGAPQQQYPPYGAPQAQGTDAKAVISLVASLVWLGGLASIAAVILGHLSRSEARRKGQQPSGLAMAGLILGYLGIAGTALIVALVIAFGGEVIDEGEALAELSTASQAQERFHDSTGRYATAVEELRGYGYDDLDGDVDVRVVRATAGDYCLEIRSFGTTWKASAGRTDPEPGSC